MGKCEPHLVIQSAGTRLEHSVRHSGHQLVVLVVEQLGAPHPAVGVTTELDIESSHGMGPHQDQALLAGEAESPVVVAHCHGSVAIVLRVVLPFTGQVLLPLIGRRAHLNIQTGIGLI